MQTCSLDQSSVDAIVQAFAVVLDSGVVLGLISGVVGAAICSIAFHWFRNRDGQ